MNPKTSRQSWREYSVYDAEWIPGTLEVRLVGYYDGRRFARYNSFKEFLSAQLTPSNHNRWFYAHAGGLADVQFVLEQLIQDDRFYVTACFSGSSAIIVDVRDKRRKYLWRFIDSFWLLRDKLSNIGKWIGINKTGPTDSMTEDEVIAWYTNVGDAELEDYCEQDCIVLWQAIAAFERELLQMGGELRTTQASCALDLFLRKYLKSELPCNTSLNLWARDAYVGSRVEVFQRHAEDFNYYDINSSFPFSMTRLLPGKIKSISDRRLPLSGPYLADVEIKTDERFLPPLPYRAKGRIFFPTGSWRSYLFWVDIETLLEHGGDIIKVHDVIEFEPFNDLADYAHTLYAKRGTAEGFQKQVYKLLLNSLYGKFAESPIKQKIHINPTRKVLERLAPDSDRPDRSAMLMPGVWLENVEASIQHEHVALSAAITAWSRKSLLDYMVMAKETYYCDTDGFAVSREHSFPTGTKLGDLKLEKVALSGDFIAPKVYRIQTEKDTLYKAKGFSLGDQSTARGKEKAARHFEALLEGREVQLRRMSRIRENLKRGTTVPWEAVVEKKFGSVFPKRCFDSEGKSRPWTVTEIQKRLKLAPK